MKAALFLIAIALAGCDYLSDTVTSRYANLAEARAAGLFDRGWLPDVLPPSAHDIVTSNDLDLDVSTGEFSFAAADSAQLYKHWSPQVPRMTFVDWSGTVSAYADRGFSAWSYRDGRSTWAFFCTSERTRCEYFLSVERRT